MEFKLIPDDRRIYLDPKIIKKYGNYYAIKKMYAFEAPMGSHPCFRLRRKIETSDSIGNTFLSRDYSIKIPECLEYQTFSLSYDKDYINIWLGKNR